MKLFKYNSLEDDDVDLPANEYVGLSRHEFFDVILCVSRRVGGGDDGELYALLDAFVSAQLNEHIYKNMASLRPFLKGDEMSQRVKAKLRKHSSALTKLFNKYKSLDNAEKLNESAWMAMAVELCAVASSFDASMWSLGGKPDMNAMAKCFILCRDRQLLQSAEIGYVEFLRCLVHFTAELFKYAPDAKYAVVPFEEKLELVLKWCGKLDTRKVKISSAKLVRSDSHRMIKRNMSISPPIALLCESKFKQIK